MLLGETDDLRQFASRIRQEADCATQFMFKFIVIGRSEVYTKYPPHDLHSLSVLFQSVAHSGLLCMTQRAFKSSWV